MILLFIPLTTIRSGRDVHAKRTARRFYRVKEFTVLRPPLFYSPFGAASLRKRFCSHKRQTIGNA